MFSVTLPITGLRFQPVSGRGRLLGQEEAAPGKDIWAMRAGARALGKWAEGADYSKL